ncbi:hypothetical protein BDA96_04G146100 [Sorghum bicolor]|uniref:Uncharacterized protein n=1 Tax=Sorghum bicolor TaxID=4558 RepID=A0A921R527_SORBI|nr:hypothetical protein BDA96_04G146100 [Sorghum bicolor]KAG0532910.1 hypothetical protein BDA96_04G146100 [Sorghum bicolor]KAG0532911.1 hypothetical protein BDA96_04G146100 [Sorghum bicolor]KAG0532912.1 hypothetical protein BDA96_04G146100 [Sorghum bicolor]KAG0532913.1 hypothetical protein BDA96_04G146100 [Sorghum bicolor]
MPAFLTPPISLHAVPSHAACRLRLLGISLPSSAPLPHLPLLPQDGAPSSRSRPVPQYCHCPQNPSSKKPVNKDLSPSSASKGARDKEAKPESRDAAPCRWRICGEPVTDRSLFLLIKVWFMGEIAWNPRAA